MNAIATVTDVGSKAVEFVGGAVDNVKRVGSAARRGFDRLTQAARGRGGGGRNNRNASGTPSGPSGPSGGGGSGGGGSYDSGVSNNPGGQGVYRDKFVAPTKIMQLSTPITNQTFTYSPNLWPNNSTLLHMKGIYFVLPTDGSNTDIQYFWKNVLVRVFQTAAQSAVNFNIDPLNTLTSSMLATYMNDVAYALQIYYFYTSILAYVAYEGGVNNLAMLNLRNSITNNDVSYLNQLAQLLSGIPVPPRLNDLMFYLSQTYATSAVKGASLIKFMPIPFENVPTSVNYNGFGNNSTWIRNCINNLNSNSDATVADILGKVVPNWRLTDLQVPWPDALYDPNFKTLYCNSPYVYNTTYYPPITVDNTKDITYTSFTEDLDGAIIAMFSGRFKDNVTPTPNTVWLPGLLLPTSTNIKGQIINQHAYVRRADGSYAFVPPDDNIPKGNSPTTYGYGTTSDVDARIVQGGVPVRSVNLSTVQVSSMQLVDYLLSIDMIDTSMPATG